MNFNFQLENSLRVNREQLREMAQWGRGEGRKTGVLGSRAEATSRKDKEVTENPEPWSMGRSLWAREGSVFPQPKGQRTHLGFITR